MGKFRAQGLRQHCCGDDILGSDPRKLKLEREDQAKKFKQKAQQYVSKCNNAYTKATLTEILSNFKELKVEEKSEVD